MNRLKSGFQILFQILVVGKPANAVSNSGHAFTDCFHVSGSNVAKCLADRLQYGPGRINQFNKPALGIQKSDQTKERNNNRPKHRESHTDSRRTDSHLANAKKRGESEDADHSRENAGKSKHSLKTLAQRLWFHFRKYLNAQNENAKSNCQTHKSGECFSASTKFSSNAVDQNDYGNKKGDFSNRGNALLHLIRCQLS